MATLASGYITILDSSIYAADPENITLANEGTDYCQIKIPEGYAHKPRGNPEIDPLFGGKGFLIKNGLRIEEIYFTGKVETRAEWDLINQYFTLHLESGSDQDYICIKFGSNDYHPFRDDTSTQKEIAPGILKDCTLTWSNDELLIYSFVGRFIIVW
jgi:hypothetical protein